MSQTPITKRLFIKWFIVFTIGMVLWASPVDLLWVIVIVTFANLLLMPRQERSRPLTPRDILWIFGSVFSIAVLIFASKRWLPDDFGEPVVRIIRHPALVVVLWTTSVFLTYRRYKITRSHA